MDTCQRRAWVSICQIFSCSRRQIALHVGASRGAGACILLPSHRTLAWLDTPSRMRPCYKALPAVFWNVPARVVACSIAEMLAHGALPLGTRDVRWKIGILTSPYGINRYEAGFVGWLIHRKHLTERHKIDQMQLPEDPASRPGCLYIRSEFSCPAIALWTLRSRIDLTHTWCPILPLSLPPLNGVEAPGTKEYGLEWRAMMFSQSFACRPNFLPRAGIADQIQRWIARDVSRRKESNDEQHRGGR